MQAGEFEGEVYDTALDGFDTYEAYLDNFINEDDIFYLESRDLARQLIELGLHAKQEVLKREQFKKKKQEAEEFRKNRNKEKTRTLAHTCVPKEKLDQNAFLAALAEREERVLNGRLLTILFIRDKYKKHEISGYIDFAHRLKTEDFRPYFMGKKLLPKPSDLSYYNWDTGICVSNDSPNFKVDASNGSGGLLFRNKRDRKVINVDPTT